MKAYRAVQVTRGPAKGRRLVLEVEGASREVVFLDPRTRADVTAELGERSEWSYVTLRGRSFDVFEEAIFVLEQEAAVRELHASATPVKDVVAADLAAGAAPALATSRTVRELLDAEYDYDDPYWDD